MANLTSQKAKVMLKEGTARGHNLTKRQKGFFGAVAGGISTLAKKVKK